MFHDVNSVIQEFNSIETSWSKTLLGKSKSLEQKNQNVLDSLLKSCLPVIWNYQDVFLSSNTDDTIDYIPEGVNDAATVSLRNGAQIMVWKEMVGSKKFEFQWFPFACNFHKKDFEPALRSQFPVINNDSCFSDEKSLIHYKYNNKSFENLNDCIKYFKNENDFEQNKMNVCVVFGCVKDMSYFPLVKSSVMFSEHKNFKFTGDWDDDFIVKFNSKTDFMNELKSIPEQIRMFCKDKYGWLFVHDLLCNKSEWCENDILHFKGFL